MQDLKMCNGLSTAILFVKYTLRLFPESSVSKLFLVMPRWVIDKFRAQRWFALQGLSSKAIPIVGLNW
jgi:hypothetical protein